MYNVHHIISQSFESAQNESIQGLKETKSSPQDIISYFKLLIFLNLFTVYIHNIFSIYFTWNSSL